MKHTDFNAGLLDFLRHSVTPYHAAEVISAHLLAADFREVSDPRELHGADTGIFYRRGGSIVALKPGRKPLPVSGLRMVGAHTDSPCLTVKPEPDLSTSGYLQLGVEVYGGALLNPWFDRDLSLAGKVSYRTGSGELATTLIDFEEAIAVIPSLAIHLDREANTNRSVNAQTQMAPLLGISSEAALSLRELLANRLRERELKVEKVLDFELCFYDVQPPALIGLRKDFIASARLDNLLSCYTGLQALLQSDDSQWSLLVCNDHEEVGSRSATGAAGPMLERFLRGLLPEPADFDAAIHRSMLISADNAHGVHPNYVDKHDVNHGPLLNGGPVIKKNASQRYASDSEGAGLFRLLAEAEGVAVQSFVMRADMACGSTIGPITAGELGVTTLDIGVPTFAMHSIRELAGSDDAWMLSRVLRRFFECEDVRARG
ncbi:MAG: M18 family aminopeptidase [Congregibacter sp.]